ncbi:mediator of RNA polymerase II transcription subunit 28 [Brachionus plicatilis]|uniref:Mediator of RNA polymerase II transcription subunit 28 n=1 Tax=Brachionus plicatilis TaxID=10195 RepID=A0A3M7SCI6_BRAPC|nr:mediator of RNA polymerase II transcription subunit 28 [Brachionus plicatilis]
MMTDNDQNPFDSYINDLETAFKSFISIYNVDLIEHKTKHEPVKKPITHSTEQTKSAIDQTVNELYEKAHVLETQFLRHRLEISKNCPDEFLNEEIECLRAELIRKDELLTETKKKIAGCEQVLRNLSTNLDNKFKNRIEMTTQGYIPNENQLNFPNIPSNQQPPSVSGNQSFEQPSSLDNSVILLQ